MESRNGLFERLLLNLACPHLKRFPYYELAEPKMKALERSGISVDSGFFT